MTIAPCDLHLHTHWSYDATAPVEYYFSRAAELGLTHIAITEHHHMDSIGEVVETAKNYPMVNYFPAAELTVYCELGTFDIVCLGLPVTPTPELQQVFDIYHQWQRDYGDALSAGFTGAGYPYSREERQMLLQQYRPEKAIALQGITHVQYVRQGEYLISKGFFRDLDEYYASMKKMDLPHYPDADIVIPAVHRAGGVAIIAHPINYFERDNRKRMDALRERLNLDGIECAHPEVPPELTQLYRNYCRKHKMLSSAGSDRHTIPVDIDPKHPGQVGSHIGEPEWLTEILERVTAFHG